jgi:hypothetical protein
MIRRAQVLPQIEADDAEVRRMAWSPLSEADGLVGPLMIPARSIDGWIDTKFTLGCWNQICLAPLP